MTAVDEVVEEGLDLVENGAVINFTPPKHLIQLVAIGAVVGTGVGATLGYFIAKRQLTTKYEKIAAKEIAEAKVFYDHLHKRAEGLSTPEEAADTLIPSPEVAEAADALITYQGKGDDEPKPIDVNVFKQGAVDDNFDYEEELAKRTPDRPYIISEEEFLQNEQNFSQTTLTYYAGDATLADEEDQVIPYIDPVLGQNNLRFGHGSGDARTVYICNEARSSIYEVLKSDGKYAHEVLGLEHADGGNRGRRQRNEIRKVRGEHE